MLMIFSGVSLCNCCRFAEALVETARALGNLSRHADARRCMASLDPVPGWYFFLYALEEWDEIVCVVFLRSSGGKARGLKARNVRMLIA